MTIAAGQQAKADDALACNLMSFRKPSRYHYTINTKFGVGTPPANQLWASYFLFSPTGLKITKISYYYNVGQAGKKVRLGLYKDNGSCYPGDLISDCGEIDISSSGLKEITGLNLTPLPGLIWIAWVSDANAVQVRVLDATTEYHNMESPLGISSSGDPLSEYPYSYYKAFTYAALPNPFPASGATESANIYGVGIFLETV